MGLYAKLNENSIVTNIIVADAEFMSSFSEKDFYVNASVDDFSTKPKAAVGMLYDNQTNTFLPLKPFPSWILNENYEWVPPIDNFPTGIGQYEWSEEVTGWIESNHPTGVVLPDGWSDELFGLTGLGVPAVENIGAAILLSGYDPNNLPSGMTVLPPELPPIPEFHVDIPTGIS